MRIDKNWPKITNWEKKVLDTTKWVLDQQLLFIRYVEILGMFWATKSMFWTLSNENWPKLTENYLLAKEGARCNETSSRPINTLYLVPWEIRLVLVNKLRILNSLQWELTENYQLGKEGARYNEMHSRPSNTLYLVVWDIR